MDDNDIIDINEYEVLDKKEIKDDNISQDEFNNNQNKNYEGFEGNWDNSFNLSISFIILIVVLIFIMVFM